MENLKLIVDEYPLNYCFMLEDVYGKGLMSEGGTKAIDEMFKNVNINGKRILDVGSGLGGLAFHLSRKFNCKVVGLEINQKMIEEAQSRTPFNLKGKVNFKLYDDIGSLPFKDSEFDLICSKGVLVHVNNKLILFKELNRILKNDGTFLIIDWLCSDKGCWGDKIKKLCEMEGLTLCPIVKARYLEILQEAGFNVEKVCDCSSDYADYNMALVNCLRENQNEFVKKYNKQAWQDNIDGYRMISESQREGELIVMEFTSSKSPSSINLQ